MTSANKGDLTANLGMESLSLHESPGLSVDTLPFDILLIILGFLDTAQSVARVGATCKKLHQVIVSDGWRIFVRKHFQSLTLPPEISQEDWQALARTLTWQSQSWDRRAFVVDMLVSWESGDRRRNTRTPQPRRQTVPFSIIVDAHTRFRGLGQEETVVWGAGEDTVARFRDKRGTESLSEKWLFSEGSKAGFVSGRDDITSISILDHARGEGQGAVVGRASGDLRLVSLDHQGFNRTLSQFRPSQTDAAEDGQPRQSEIQSFDISGPQDVLAAGTKDHVFLYSLDASFDGNWRQSNDPEKNVALDVAPIESINLNTFEESTSFKFLRGVKFMANGSLALGMTSSAQPLRYLDITPTGIRMNTANRIHCSDRGSETYVNDWENGTARALLPVDMTSVAGGRGNVLLTSYDDGTVRLQDIRTPSTYDTIYQDNFEPTTAVGSLLSYGTDRFIGGSARSAVIKIFDYRWSRTYDYTAALPCGQNPPYPLPIPPTTTTFPDGPRTSRCNHLLNKICQWHRLSRTDYFRPNFNIYVPYNGPFTQSIYSLAKSSDISPTIYVGLAGALAELNLKDPATATSTLPPALSVPSPRLGGHYRAFRAPCQMVETGDGFALDSVADSHRVPTLREQALDRVRHLPLAHRKRHRLDEWFQLTVEHYRVGERIGLDLRRID